MITKNVTRLLVIPRFCGRPLRPSDALARPADAALCVPVTTTPLGILWARILTRATSSALFSSRYCSAIVPLIHQNALVKYKYWRKIRFVFLVQNNLKLQHCRSLIGNIFSHVNLHHMHMTKFNQPIWYILEKKQVLDTPLRKCLQHDRIS